MFGYACTETEALMPLRSSSPTGWPSSWRWCARTARCSLRPDGKTQVTIEYDGDRPVRVDTVVLSSQHAADIDLDALLAPDARKHVVDPVLERFAIDASDYQLLVNLTGRFEIGGPMGDAGLTGRKIIVDTYGGMSRHGGGPSRARTRPRSTARGVRDALGGQERGCGEAERCEVQVAYAIGKAHPVGFYVETFGTEVVPVSQIQQAVLEVSTAAGRHHPRPGSEATDLRPDRGVWALRPGLPGVTWRPRTGPPPRRRRPRLTVAGLRPSRPRLTSTPDGFPLRGKRRAGLQRAQRQEPGRSAADGIATAGTSVHCRCRLPIIGCA